MKKIFVFGLIGLAVLCGISTTSIAAIKEAPPRTLPQTMINVNCTYNKLPTYAVINVTFYRSLEDPSGAEIVFAGWSASGRTSFPLSKYLMEINGYYRISAYQLTLEEWLPERPRNAEEMQAWFDIHKSAPKKEVYFGKANPIPSSSSINLELK